MPPFKKTYNERIIKGKTSLKDALEAGAEIEEIDILDQEKHITQTENTDITGL